MHEVEIRDMRLEDIAPVYALGERLFTADRWPTLYRTWDEMELVSLYGSAGSTCLVADTHEALAGFVLGNRLDKRGPWSYGYLLWLGVAPERAGNGLGGRLVDALTRRFIEQGARMMLVDTEADNTPAIRLFKRKGFGHERPHVYLSLNLTGHPDYQRAREETT